MLIDRLALSPEVRSRIVDAIETGYRESGEVQFHTLVPSDSSVQNENGAKNLRFSAAFECSTCHRAYREPEPRLFSFNNPYGACPRCQGFGNTIDFDPDLILPDRSRTLAQGAIAPWTTAKYRPFHGEMIRFAKSAAIPTDVPWYDLDAAQQELLWEGRGSWPGIRGFFAALERKRYKLHVRVFLSRYRGYALCPDCRGQRLRAEARAVLIAPRTGPAKNICEVTALTISAAQAFFDDLQLSPAQTEIAGKVLEEVRQRIHFLQQVGLDYLTLDRLSSTLSGGESQRIQLATSLGSRLVGALYVLDEPSIGLHTRDTAKLIRILHSLRDLGNTILVVEHDPDVIRSADHLLDLGPGAGELGGHLLAAGTVAEVTANPKSITGKYLSGRLTIPVPKVRRTPGRERLVLTGARIHNLRGVDVEIPLNLLCCVTGVSGSGKSTLIHQVLYRALMQALNREPNANQSAPEPTHLYRALAGTQYLNDVVLVDQSPIGRTPRSNPVTYIKAFDEIRALFAAQPDAKRKGFTAGSFSFNVPGGRCDVCEGDGTVTVEMQFLADVELPCEECNATRYKSSILDIKYKGRNIHDVLNMTVKEALGYFAGHPRIVDKLYVLDEVGLGYVRLGQSATTLSGGEAQRVKLASHLAQARSIIERSASAPRATPIQPTPTAHPSPKPKPVRVPSTSSTSPPPASTSTMCRSSSPPSANSLRAAARCWSSSTISTSSSPPTGSSTWAPKAAPPAARSSPSAPPNPSPPTPPPTPAATSPHCSASLQPLPASASRQIDRNSYARTCHSEPQVRIPASDQDRIRVDPESAFRDVAYKSPSRNPCPPNLSFRACDAIASVGICFCIFLRNALQILRQILPRRIHTLDQCHLPRPIPALQLLLPCNRIVDVLKPLEVDQPMNLIASGKAARPPARARDVLEVVFVTVAASRGCQRKSLSRRSASPVLRCRASSTDWHEKVNARQNSP